MSEPLSPDAPDSGDSRRTFLQKLTYVAPVMTTYLLSQTAFATQPADVPGNGRARGRTSPHPGRHLGNDKAQTQSDATPPPPVDTKK